MLAIANWVEGLLYFSLVELDLLTNVFEPVLTTLKIDFLYFIFVQQVPSLFLLLLHHLLQLFLLLANSPQP